MSRPLVTWKYGASLDGRIAAADGSSKWITSQEARTDVHRLRAECDAVMVGSGTQATDDPHLAVRHVQGRQPFRVVVDSNARTPASARVLDDAAPTLIAVAEDADAAHLEGKAAVVRLPAPSVGWICRRCSRRWRSATSAPSSWKAAPPWPGHSWPKDSSTGWSATSRRCSSAAVACLR
jgi:riboflavin biosynthesis pyrimidine reductase